MNTPGRFVHRVLPAIAGFAFVLGSIAHPVMAQKAKPQQTDTMQAPLPVTPFGPRVKPPRATTGVPVAPRKPLAEVIAKYGIWRVKCEQPPIPAKGEAKADRKVCYVQATQRDPKLKNVTLSIFIFKVKGKGPDGKVRSVYMIDMRAPLGVYLPTGIGLEIDGKPVSRAPFLSCNPIFCDSMAETRKETIDRLKKGKKAKFIYYAAPGRGLPLVFDLKGFSAAMKKLDEVSK